MAARRSIRWLLAVALPLAAVVAGSAASAEPTAPLEQKQSARIRVGGRAIEVLGLAWDEPAVVGKFDFRDPEEDRALRMVTLAVSDRDRGVFAIPELGDEVVLEFIEGDPDRPIVLGLLSSKVDEVAPGDDDEGGRWVSVRISFRAVRRAKGGPSDP